MNELLELIKNSELISMPELTEQLGMSPTMIFAMLERLEQLGFVRRIIESDVGCSSHCGGCKGCGTSGIKSAPQIYWIANS